jgi:putative adhesin/cell wall-active antibiotic response 4TMS protein YvqF
MSNPVITPTPRRRRRSFSGPFVLIFLGVLFLLGNLHVLSWARLGVWFAHYWPLLLILWGIIKLIEYQAAQREGTSPPGIGAGGIFLVIVIVFFGLIATQASRFNWNEIRDNMGIDDEDFKNMFGESYNFDDHLERDFPAGASLKVLDNHGAVSVHASDDNKITVIVHKRIGAGNQSDADKYNSETEPTITTIGGLVTVDAKVEGAGDHPVQTDLDISLPRKAAVSIASRHGEVNVVAREGNLEVSTQRGDTSVEEITGNVKLTLERSSAKVEQVTGDVHVEGRLTDVSVSDVKGSVQLDGEFMESVKLARITKSVSFKSSRTDMEFARLDGQLDLDSGDLHASEIAGPLRLTTRAKDVRLEDVSGDVRLQDDNGGVEISMRLLGNVQIDSRKGDVQFSVPEKAGFRVDARTRDGEISSEFPELKVENGDHEAKASGSVGNATAHLVINNDHGGIEIRKAAGPPPTPPVPPSPGKAGKPGKSLPSPKEDVEPTEN